MGATSTMFVTRRDALASLAAIENASLDDDTIAERLNDAIRRGGFALDEVRIGSSTDANDAEHLERITRSIAG